MLTRNIDNIKISTIFLCLLLIILNFGLVSCSNKSQTAEIFETEKVTPNTSISTIQEVAVPAAIEKLKENIEYQPKIAIISPKQGENFDKNALDLELEVKDFPIYRDPELNLGPHLKIILDDRPIGEVYDLDEDISWSNLSPGVHTVRVLAMTPWNESFKNKAAYAIASFNVVEEESEEPQENKTPDLSSSTILTYNSPRGDIAAEPILLDFYLSNPDPKYQIQVTVNKDSFVVDRDTPIYLQGFDLGKNSVELKLLDAKGNPVDADFSNAVEEFNYQPNEEDPLSKILGGDISTEVATKIVDPDYKPASANLEEIKPSDTSESEESQSKETEVIPEELPVVSESEESQSSETEKIPEELPVVSESEESQSSETEKIPEELPVVSESEESQSSETEKIPEEITSPGESENLEAIEGSD